jgi:hypothetical protein
MFGSKGEIEDWVLRLESAGLTPKGFCAKKIQEKEAYGYKTMPYRAEVSAREEGPHRGSPPLVQCVLLTGEETPTYITPLFFALLRAFA